LPPGSVARPVSVAPIGRPLGVEGTSLTSAKFRSLRAFPDVDHVRKTT
jgi:hypothetical protein